MNTPAPALFMLTGEQPVTDPKRLVSLLLAHAMLTDITQSNLYKSNLTSIPYILATYQNDPIELCDKLSTALTKLYTRYFLAANINCEYDQAPNAVPNGSLYRLKVFIVATGYDNQEYTIGLEQDVSNGVLVNVINFENN